MQLCLNVTVNTQASTTPTCAVPNYVDLWYDFTAVSTSMNFELGTLPGNIVFYAFYEGSCAGNQVACGFLSAFGSTEATINGLNVGTVYKIQILHIPSSSGPEQEICVFSSTAVSLAEHEMELSQDKDGIILEWEDRAQNGEYFELLKREANNDYFESLVFINELDESQENHFYLDTDVSPGSKYFYRIVKYDANGNLLYQGQSNIVFELTSNPNDPSMQIFPNPAVDVLNIKCFSNVNESALINLRDLNGKLVLTNKHQLISGNNEMLMDIEQLNAGIFLVSIESNTINAFQRIIVK